MKPKVSLITLGVTNYEASLRFYRDGLGFPTDGQKHEDVTFFVLDNVHLAIYPREKLAKDATVPNDGTGFAGFSLAHNVDSPEAVDAVLAEAVAAGAKLVKPGQKVFWGGYAGYFADPDGFLWEVAHNPFMDLT